MSQTLLKADFLFFKHILMHPFVSRRPTAVKLMEVQRKRTFACIPGDVTGFEIHVEEGVLSVVVIGELAGEGASVLLNVISQFAIVTPRS